MQLQKAKEKKLTLKQEKFCQLYATDANFFGNATQAYIKAYGIDTSQPGAYGIARASASQNLTKPYISMRINSLLEEIGFTDIEVDKQLAFVIMQHGDLKAKMAAIREYNVLKKRTTPGSSPQVNFIQLILKKWGLDDVEAIDWDEGGVPQDRA